MIARAKSFFSLTIFFLAQNIFLHAQISSNVDSIRTALLTRANDTVRVMLLDDLAWNLRQENQTEALDAAKKAIDLSTQLKYARGIAKSARLIGIIDRIMGDNDGAIAELKTAIGIYDSLHIDKGLGDSYNSLGEVYRITGENAEALKNYQAGLDLFRKSGDKKNIALLENNMGIIYYNEQQYDKALNLYQDALQLRRDVNDKKGISISLNNIANVYGKEKDYDRSLIYQQELLRLNREMNYREGVALSYSNIGELHSDKKEDEAAILYYDSSLTLYCLMQDSANIVDVMIKKGQSQLFLGKYPDAKKLLLQGYVITQRLGLKEMEFYALSALPELFEHEKNYKEAYKYSTLLYALRDSMVSETRIKTVNELETKYETKQKQQEIEMLSQKNHVQELEKLKDEEEINRGHIIIYSAFGGGFLVVILLFVMFRSYRIKRKANLDLEQKNNIILQKNKSITDSIEYAKRIQKSLLPTEKYIERNLNRLQEKK